MRIIRIYKGMTKSLLTSMLISTFLMVVGCASTLSEDERLWRRSIDNENYANCSQVFDQSADAFMIHWGHRHGKNDRVYQIDIRHDLAFNQCKSILRDYWVEY